VLQVWRHCELGRRKHDSRTGGQRRPPPRPGCTPGFPRGQVRAVGRRVIITIIIIIIIIIITTITTATIIIIIITTTTTTTTTTDAPLHPPGMWWRRPCAPWGG
jgi:hypothetical protein